MSKGVLIGSLVACVLAVGLIAVLTATVIVDEGGNGGRILRAEGSFPPSGPGETMPGPGRGAQGHPQGPMPRRGFGRLPELRECLQKQGIGPNGRLQPPGPGAMRDAMKACAGMLPDAPPALR